MAAQHRAKVREADLQGFKYFQLLQPLLERLHDVGTARDKAGNRQLFFDHYAALLLLYFFSPIVTSLRGLQEATALDKVQKFLGIRRIALGSLSEATGVFDVNPLREIVQELAERALPLEQGREAEALRGLTAVDGSLLPALPKMVWALWMDAQHRAAKLHLQFDVLKGVPCDATVTPGASSEPDELRAMLQPSRLYVLDRGYASYQLFRDIRDAQSSFIGRVKDNTAFTLAEERSIPTAAQQAGVLRDLILTKLGTDHHKDYLQQPVRLVIVRRTKPDGTTEQLWLVTDCLDLPAELVGLAYRYRWTIELFFRWFKCILGCRHLLAHDANGVAIQVYVALIASLLIVLWTGRKPTKRTWEMLQFYLIGWATLEELERHLNHLPVNA
jgi:DDE family transposase